MFAASSGSIASRRLWICLPFPRWLVSAALPALDLKPFDAPHSLAVQTRINGTSSGPRYNF
jgi:hypothetical protein